MFLPAGSCTEVLTLLWGTQHLWNSPPIANSRVWAVAAGLKKNIPVPSTVWSWWLCWWAAPEALLLFRRVFFFFFFAHPSHRGLAEIELKAWRATSGLQSCRPRSPRSFCHLHALPRVAAWPTGDIRRPRSLVLNPCLHWTISLFFLSKGCCLLRHWICVGVSVCQN